jgi:preprotein translocase subunit SecE
MSEQVANSSAFQDTMKVAISAILAVSSFVAFYFLPTEKQVWINWIAFIVLLSLAFFVFLKHTTVGKELLTFFKESIAQGKKIVWPTRKEVGKITMAVFVFALVMSLFVFGTDHALQWLIYSVFLGWR